MIDVYIHVPVADNDGETFADPHHRLFEAALTSHFGGFTRLPGTAYGAWRDEATGKVYHDTSYIYLVLVAGLVGNEAPRKAAILAKSHYRQEAILLRYLGVAEII